MKEEDLLHGNTFRDLASTVEESGARMWIYATASKGGWTNKRRIIAYFYLSIFFIMPFIKVHDLPFMMMNIPKGKFILFSKIFWPQDFFIFAITMITFILFIILFTVVFGRLFCGWVCPQTVFMEFVFRPIEFLIEGSASQQVKLNKGPWDTNKVIRKTAKHIVYLAISFIIAHTFLSYILGLDEVVKIIHEPIKKNTSLLLGIIVFTLLFYCVFAFIRDIVCTTICPYGRLQSVMVDKDTMQISYDYNRGEPRGKIVKEVERTSGDCISCNKCVQVCPTGIDIRNGVQMECVGCTACIDACDNVMDSLKFERGLIRYASENEVSSGTKFKFNSRMKAYTAVCCLLLLFMMFLVGSRRSIDTNITRVKGQLFQVKDGDKISNLFDAKIINKTRNRTPITLKVEGIYSAEIEIVGKNDIVLKEEAINELTFFLKIPKGKLEKRITDIKIGVYSENILIQIVSTKFLGPFNNNKKI